MKTSPDHPEHCMKCIQDQALDLTTYKCVNICPANTVPMRSKYNFLSDKYSSKLTFCRPYDPSTKEISLYVDNNLQKNFEAGTPEYPFGNLAFAFVEPFNFRTTILEYGLSTRIYLSAGEHVVHAGVFPLYSLSSSIALQPWRANTKPIIRFE